MPQSRKPPRNAVRLWPRRDRPAAAARHVLRVAAAEHHVVGEEGAPCRVGTTLDHAFAPLLLAGRSSAARPRHFAERRAPPCRRAARARAGRSTWSTISAEPSAGAQAEEQHPAAVVAAQRLHGGVVDDPHRPFERGGEVEADPAGAEVARLGPRAVVADLAGVADRDGAVLPVRARCASPPAP